MNQFLKTLYRGDFSPCSKCFQRDSEFGKTMETITKLENQLIEKLRERDSGLITNYINAIDKLMDLSSEEYFIIGFRSGVRIMVEAMDENDGCLKDIDV